MEQFRNVQGHTSAKKTTYYTSENTNKEQIHKKTLWSQAKLSGVAPTARIQLKNWLAILLETTNKPAASRLQSEIIEFTYLAEPEQNDFKNTANLTETNNQSCHHHKQHNKHQKHKKQLKATKSH